MQTLEEWEAHEARVQREARRNTLWVLALVGVTVVGTVAFGQKLEERDAASAAAIETRSRALDAVQEVGALRTGCEADAPPSPSTRAASRESGTGLRHAS